MTPAFVIRLRDWLHRLRTRLLRERPSGGNDRYLGARVRPLSLRHRLRGLRARLVVTYVLLALVVVSIGGVLFVIQIERGFAASTDANLVARGAALVADVESARVVTNPAPATRLTVAEIYRPNGTALSPAEAGSIDPVTVAQARRGRVFVNRTIRGVPVRMLALPAQRSDGTWVVVVGTDTRPADEATDRVEAEVLIGAPILVLVAGLGAWTLSGAALRPVEKMRADAADIGAHDLTGRISDPGTGDELASLAHTFNDLLDRLHASALQQRTFVADAGHELRTPLAVLSTELELADRPNRTRDQLADAVVHARSEVARLSRLADDLLLIASLDEGRPIRTEPTVVKDVLEASERAYRSRAADASVIVTTEADATVAHADPTALRRIVDNLLANAITAVQPGGHVWVSGRGTPDHAEIVVRDDGPGFPDDFLSHAVARFSRADIRRSDTSGSGLGLAIVDELVRAHAGTVALSNARPHGACITVTIPSSRRSEEGTAAGRD